MATMSTDRARELLGALNGHDVLVGGHANHNGMDLIAAARRPWFWPQRVGKDRQPRERGPEGSRLIAWALALLFALGLGLLTVSYAAQFRYVMAERHQEVASAIEAGCWMSACASCPCWRSAWPARACPRARSGR